MSLRIWDIVLFLLQWFSSLNGHLNCHVPCVLHIVHHIMFCMIWVIFHYITILFTIQHVSWVFLIVQSKFTNGCWLDRKLNSFWLLQPSLEPFVDDAHYFASIFEIRFCCLIIHIPISYIKSVSFLDCPRSGPGPNLDTSTAVYWLIIIKF